MTKTQRNWLRVPGLFLRIPLLCITYYVAKPAIKGIEWMCDNWFKGLDL